MPTWAVYDEDPERYAQRYEAVAFASLHAPWLDLLPETPGRALDVGAGSGRDAAALAARGWAVDAVEPAGRLRALAAARHPSPRIRWIDDALPELSAVRAAGGRYELVLVSAVWMYVPASEASRCLEALAGLLTPAGLLVVSAKAAGASPGQRDVPEDELLRLGRALEPVRHVAGASDQAGRPEVRWTLTALRRPLDPDPPGRGPGRLGTEVGSTGGSAPL